MIAKTYLDVYKEHTGFMSHKWVHYFFIYDRIFNRFLEKNKPINILEIGVQNGGSLEIWKKYLPEGSTIHGIDIDEKCLQLKFSEGIYFHLGNASDIEFMEKTFGNIKFDVIIDDGSHICNDIIQTFEYLFPKMQNGGCYIVEDTHTSYWKEFGGNYIEYFKRLIDSGINKDYIRAEDNLFPKQESNSEITKMISQISFFDSVIAIDKFYGVKEIPFKNITTGDIALVDEEPLKLNVTVEKRQNDIIITEKLFCS